MSKEFLGEDALARLIELIKTEFTKYLKTEEAQELLAQMNEALAGKLDKAEITAGNYYLYGVNSDGKTQKMYYLGYVPMAGRVPLYDTDGQLRVGFAVRGEAAVPLAQMNEILDARLGSLDAALDEVLALQEFYTGDAFAEIHEYAEGVIAGGDA